MAKGLKKASANMNVDYDKINISSVENKYRGNRYNNNSSYRRGVTPNKVVTENANAKSHRQKSLRHILIGVVGAFVFIVIGMGLFIHFIGIDANDKTITATTAKNEYTSSYSNGSSATFSGNLDIFDASNELGYEYCCVGLIEGKGTVKEFGSGSLNYNELVALNKSYLKNAEKLETDNGLSPQKALDLISTAFNREVMGSVHVYRNYIEARETEGNYSADEFQCFRVVYCPNGSEWASKKSVACYEIYASTDKSFSDTNTSGVVLDKKDNIIGIAN